MRVISSFAVIFFHVCGAVDLPENLNRLVKFRDFALPVMVVSSFFVLTVSLDRKAEDFSRFFARRFTRIFIPLIIWTIVYTIFFLFLATNLSGVEAAIETFSPVVFLTGYRHLWYLQFIFLGSLICFPIVVRLLNCYGFARVKIFSICIFAAVFCQILYQLVVRERLREILSADMDVNVQIFADQTSRYLFYIPVGIGLGLISNHIVSIFQNAFFRKFSSVSAIIAMLLHVRFFIPFSQEIYGLAIFSVALQPLKKVPNVFWKNLVAYSYGIYILHFFGIHLLWLYTFHFNLEISLAAIICAALFIYFSSFLCAVLIRKSFPVDWLIPLIKS